MEKNFSVVLPELRIAGVAITIPAEPDIGAEEEVQYFEVEEIGGKVLNEQQSKIATLLFLSLGKVTNKIFEEMELEGE